ncbi:hypothetical protein GC170_02580 [bacterium]|nr:hypothetical protein [bacterium]
MNRREMTRWSILGGMMLRPALHALGDDTPATSGHSVPMEPLPELAALETPVSLKDAIAQGRIRAQWSSRTSQQVRLSFTNTSDKPIALKFDPGTTLTDGARRWLAGGPSRFEGSFGGHFVFDSLTDRLRWAAIPALPGRETSLTVPAVLLTPYDNTAKSVPDKPLTAEPLESWSKDEALVSALEALATLGSSVPVAQGIAWRAVEAKSWKTLSDHEVQGRVLNEFEKQASDRFLAEIARIGAVAPDALSQALLGNLLEIVVRSTPGKGDAAKRLAESLKGRSIFGLPIKAVITDPRQSASEHPMRAEFAVIESSSQDPGRMVLDATFSSRSDAPGGSIRWARTKAYFGVESSDPAESADRFLEDLTARFAASLVRTERTGTGSMYSRFRVENHSPWTISAVAFRTDSGTANPAIWPVDGLGLSPRGRTIVPVPADRALPFDLRWSPI